MKCDQVGQVGHGISTALIYGFEYEIYCFFVSDIELDFNEDEESPGKENIEGSGNRPQRNQSFVRNETKRRVICHRRTPSAPTTPKRDIRDVGSSCRDVDEVLKQQLTETDKSVSQPVLQGALSAKPPRNDRAKTSQKKLFESDSFADTHKLRYSSADEIVSEKRKGSKTPPKDRKKLKEEKSADDYRDSSEKHSPQGDRTRHGSDKDNLGNASKGPLIKELRESPGSRRKSWSRSASTPEEPVSGRKESYQFYSRVHDYAEIDDKDLDPAFTESHIPKTTSKSEFDKTEQIMDKSRPSPKQDTKTKRYHVESIENLQDLKGVESQNVSRRSKVISVGDVSNESKLLETNFFIDNEKPVVVHSVSLDHSSRTSSSSDTVDTSASSSQYLPHEDLLSEISNFEKGLETIQQYPYKQSFSKCMSIPSDIQKSLENISNGSDIMSSVTISELSQSQDNVFVNESDTLTRRRRSTSLDGLSDESPMSRTLREINAQIDRAFKQDKPKAYSLRDLQGKSRSLSKDSSTDIASQLISYDSELVESPPRQRSFGSVRESDIKTPVERTCSAPEKQADNAQANLISNNNQSDASLNQNKFVDRPAAEIHIVEAPKVIRAPLRPSTTPTRPSPPGSLDIVSPTSKQGIPLQAAPGSRLPTSQSDNHINQHNTNIVSPTLAQRSAQLNRITAQAKTGFRLSEEDFQKALLAEDPDSLKHFQQSMMYSPVRSNRRGVFDGERSNRSSLASPDASGPKGRSSFVSPEASPVSYSRQQHSKTSQSPDASPSSYSRIPHSKFSPSPKSESKHQHPRVPQSPKSENKIYRSPQTDKRQFHQSPQTDKRNKDSPVIEKKGPSPKVEKKIQDRGVVQSPLSPEHKQPRWEDLAGLNDSFSEIDLAMFNEDWKNQLAPTGDSIRQSNKTSHSEEKWSSQTQIYPEAEVSTDTDTVVVERQSIKRKNIPEKVSQSATSEVEYYDNVPEHHWLIPEGGNNQQPVSLARQQVQQSNTTVSQAVSPPSPGSRVGFSVRAVLERSHTVPGPSVVPQSQSNWSGYKPILEQSTSFESASGLKKQVSFDSGTTVNSSYTNREKSAVKKSSTTPSLTRQTSFDSSSYSSVRVTSRGSSFEEIESSAQNQVMQAGQGAHVSVKQETHAVIQSNDARNLSNQPTGTFISITANDRNPITATATVAMDPSGFTVSHQSSQSAILIRGDSGQSADTSFPNLPQQGRTFRGFNMSSNISDNLPRMLEEIDPNESCLGLASHQNMSNEMKEMLQEQMKEHPGVMSPLDDIINPLASITSPFSLHSRTYYDTSHPLEGHDMESSIEVPSDVQSVDLPAEDIQFLSEGPVLIATPNVLTQRNTDSLPRQHVRIDNTEEEYQNALNADLERNLASLTEYLPHHVSVCEPQSQINDSLASQGTMLPEEATNLGNFSPHAPGLKNMSLISPGGFTIKDTPEPVTRDSLSSSSSSSMVSSTNSIVQQPPCDWTYRHSVIKPVFLENLNIRGDLAAPPLEMIEVCKSVITKPKTRHYNISEPVNNVTSPVGKSVTLTFDFPLPGHSAIHDSGIGVKDVKSSNISSFPPPERSAIRDSGVGVKDVKSSNISSERGETKLIIDRRPSLKKKVDKSKSETISKPLGQHSVDLVDSDHGEQSGSEDDVFIDPSEVTPNTTFYGARSKYFQRRDFLSQGSFPLNMAGAPNVSENMHEPTHNQTRCSLDESMMQMASSRQADIFSKDILLDTEYQNDFVGMDIGHENAEDLRFSKAHRSSKLMSLCEMFEKGSTTSLNSDGEETTCTREKTITPPEKNIVSSIKQMHESLEVEKEETEIFNKPKRVKKVSLNDSGSSNDSFNVSKDDSFELKTDTKETEKSKKCLSPTYTSVKEGNFLFEAPGSPEGYRFGRPFMKSSEILKETPGQGKPPKYRSNSKTRTLSESSLSENEGVKPCQKVPHTDSSPKSQRYSGSPKGSRYSQISSEEDGSPRVGRTGGSPKVQDRKTNGSPKQGKQKEGPPVAPRQSPKMSKSVESVSKIPVSSGSPKGSRFSGTTDQQLSRSSSSPKSSHNGRGSVKSDSSPKVKQRQDSSEKEVQKRSITKRGESVEERYHLNFEHQSKAKDTEKAKAAASSEAAAQRKSESQRKSEEKKRRGSIKELMNLFEEKTGGKAEGNMGEICEQSSPQTKLRTRVRSVSPTNTVSRSPPTMPANVRHSVELPVRGTLSHSEGVFKISENVYRPQQVRLGPKPFYGAK